MAACAFGSVDSILCLCADDTSGYWVNVASIPNPLVVGVLTICHNNIVVKFSIGHLRFDFWVSLISRIWSLPSGILVVGIPAVALVLHKRLDF